MKHSLKIIACFLAFAGFAALGKNPTITYKNAFNKTSTLGKRQTKALMACSFVHDLINKKDDSIDLDDLVKGLPDYVQNNIRTLISILPSACWGKGSDKNKNEETLKKEIGVLFIARKDHLSYMFDLIKCAEAVESPVRDDLIHYALRMGLIDHNILDQSDLTPQSLKSVIKYYESIKDKDGFKPHDVVPGSTVKTLLDQIKEEEKNNFDTKVINIIKTKFYEFNKDVQQQWLNKEEKKFNKLDEEVNILGSRFLNGTLSVLKKNEKVDELFLINKSYKNQKIQSLSLPNQFKLIDILQSDLHKTKNFISKLEEDRAVDQRITYKFTVGMQAVSTAFATLAFLFFKLGLDEKRNYTHRLQWFTALSKQWMLSQAFAYGTFMSIGIVVTVFMETLSIWEDYKNNEPIALCKRIKSLIPLLKQFSVANIPFPLFALGLNEPLIEFLNIHPKSASWLLLQKRKQNIEQISATVQNMIKKTCNEKRSL